MWKWIRISALLAILLSVATGEWLAQRRLWSWQRSATVAIYPIIGDDSPSTRRYVQGLTNAGYADLEQFFADEAGRYALPLSHPVTVRVYPGPVTAPPAPPPRSQGLGVVWWSLRLRYYAWRMSGIGDGQIRVYVIFHDGHRLPSLPHSMGLQRGHIGVVHAFAAAYMAGTNNFIIAHEILHTLGAQDLYDPATNLPLLPDGLGDPSQQPLYPQQFAEVMAGRRLLGPGQAETPESLAECLIGPRTAEQIHWLHR